jgi:hypothetical protein
MVNLFGGFHKRLQDCTVMNEEEEARVAAVVMTSSTMTGKKRKVNFKLQLLMYHKLKFCCSRGA